MNAQIVGPFWVQGDDQGAWVVVKALPGWSYDAWALSQQWNWVYYPYPAQAVWRHTHGLGYNRGNAAKRRRIA